MISQSNWLSQLEGKLTKSQINAFIVKAAPELEQDYADLDRLLTTQQWAAASQQAHKMKAVIKLLGLGELLPLLLSIESQQVSVISTPEFQQTLQTYYRGFINELRQSTS